MTAGLGFNEDWNQYPIEECKKTNQVFFVRISSIQSDSSPRRKNFNKY